MVPVAALFSLSGAWAFTAQSCCQRQACENLRFLYGHIAGGYAACCQKPAEQQESCFDSLNSKVSETQSLILQAKMACDSGNNDLVRDSIKKIRDLWVPKIVQLSSGAVVNQMVAFGHQDWLQIDTTMPQVDQGCSSTTLALVGGQLVNPEATGNAAELSRSSTPGVGGAEPVLVFPANAAQSYTTCTYRMPAGASFNARFGEVYNGIALSGTVSVAQTAPFPTAGSAQVGVPTQTSMVVSYLGQKLSLDLDKTSPFNHLTVNAGGEGTLGVALTLESSSPALIGMVQVGSTIYFALPVAVAPDWSSLRILAGPGTPGSTITPTDPIILAGADTTFAAIVPSSRCADDNNNGIRDGAEEVINAIKSQMGCEGSSAQH
jgi:hypothetical protein